LNLSARSRVCKSIAMGTGSFGIGSIQLRSALALCVSVCALCAGVLVESQPLGIGLALARELRDDVHVVRPVRAAPAPADGGALASAGRPLPQGMTAPEGTLVPDFEGMDLRDAFERADALGLSLVARDRWGDRVGRRYASDYEVRRQRTAAGDLVEDGARIHLRVRMDRLLQGY
jgi:hypothetical protein